MAISFGPGGNSTSFGKKKFPEDLPDYLKNLGLNGFEIECGRGVRIAEKTYKLLPDIIKENNINLSLHTPYFISLSSEKEETRLNSLTYIKDSAEAAHRLGARKIVIHSGSCAKMSREQALELAKDTLTRAQKMLDDEGLSDIIICPETMGKINQLGTLSEVLELCGVDDRFLPCVDFGHLNARTLGAIKTKDDYKKLLDEIENKLGHERLKNFHVHFSKIMYTAGGEKEHLTFEDKEYGPQFEPLMELFAERGLEPSVICESAGTQAEDASEMQKYYSEFCEKMQKGL
ncbi:MAG: TIM barrel protein [Ruminococcaceae bacterium]|nr:TIM barrel protein [Oscillospiraceae bacterium]